MKRFFSILLAVTLATSVFAQSQLFRPRLEVASVNADENHASLEVFLMNDTGKYYLSVGTLGIGDDFIQFHIDPVSELFIPLGENMTEVYEKLVEIQQCYKMGDGESREIEGCLSIAVPNDQFEPVKLTFMKLPLSRILEFSVSREGYIRATHITRADFNSLVGATKFYMKLHPNK